MKEGVGEGWGEKNRAWGGKSENVMVNHRLKLQCNKEGEKQL